MTDYDVYCGLDVGKGDHHAVALNKAGKRLHDGPLPNDEQRLRALFEKLSRHGRVLAVVDQPNTIGALPVTVARACGVEAARTLPHTLRRVDIDDEALAELGVLVGFDDDLAQESTRLVNRIRGLLTHIHPALERAIGPKTTTNAVLELLSRHGGPAGLRKAGQRKLTATAIKYAPRVGAKLVDAIMTALDEQTVVVPGTAAAADHGSTDETRRTLPIAETEQGLLHTDQIRAHPHLWVPIAGQNRANVHHEAVGEPGIATPTRPRYRIRRRQHGTCLTLVFQPAPHVVIVGSPRRRLLTKVIGTPPSYRILLPVHPSQQTQQGQQGQQQ